MSKTSGSLHPWIILASGFGSGYSPFAPGTAGSAVGLALFAPLAWYGPAWAPWVACLVFSLLGFPAAAAGERHFGKKDPGPVVIDEIAGQMLTLLWLPATPAVWIAGFFVFRVLDIFKPFPARRLEALGGGSGIMADDLVVGVYGNLLLRGALWLAPGLSGAL
ncbi:MAG: phosphatidylglycerophosphatase A [bacterium]|nr:phosphatidylglycerophosphatase A [bacterium]